MISRPRPFHGSGSTDVDVWTSDVFPAAQMRYLLYPQGAHLVRRMTCAAHLAGRHGPGALGDGGGDYLEMDAAKPS